MYHSGNNMVDAHLLFEKAQLSEGMHIADLGCGRTGHLVFPAARIIGERGVVYAVDILKDVLENVKKTAYINNLLNIQPVWADIERPGGVAIPKHSLDVAFIINTLVHVTGREAVIAQAGDLLKDKARLVIVDWAKKGLPFGPRDEEFVDFDAVETWCETHGFVLQESFDMGRFHRGLVFFRHE